MKSTRQYESLLRANYDEKKTKNSKEKKNLFDPSLVLFLFLPHIKLVLHRETVWPTFPIRPVIELNVSVQNTVNLIPTNDANKPKSNSIFQCLAARRQISLSELIHFIDLALTDCKQLRDQLDPSCTSSCSIEYPRSLIQSLLELYASHHPNDWHRYESWETSDTYTRNLIAHHSNRFTLMLVCWKGGPSPIHNHAGSDCLMCVVRGAVRETKYETPKYEEHIPTLRIKEMSNLYEGEVHLINDRIGLHKMETVDENQQAVTLHCYIPPYSDCLTYDEEKDKIKTNIAHTTYDTELGEVV